MTSNPPLPRNPPSRHTSYAQPTSTGFFGSLSSSISGLFGGSPPTSPRPLVLPSRYNPQSRPEGGGVSRLFGWIKGPQSPPPPDVRPEPRVAESRGLTTAPGRRRTRTKSRVSVHTAPLHLPSEDYISTLKHLTVLAALLEENVGIFETMENCARSSLANLIYVVEANPDPHDAINQLVTEYVAFDRLTQKLVDYVASSN
ncbi:hypothetical protein SISSUDRAFT_313260 [Sistotremastrum suecicum HHB10207 ss-3]|uniref:Uncharacterized protein n=1 Tax=Sistotremastrum suecicum HHB10207 ss-3 TaxID=1314776 RepID=A0A165ZC13_9AGAM|nr:hypothetical protein SISSUDRAFT_313260 [Sistotremastrum suecicum HHB10207 ss-3]